MRSIIPLLATVALVTTGCSKPVAVGPYIVITASYPAGRQIVADTVSAPIEQQVNGVEGMVRLESESRNDGPYTSPAYGLNPIPI